MSTESPGRSETGHLIVEVPHWTATVSIRDNALRPVRGVGRVRNDPDENGIPCVKAALPPGIYQVEVVLGDARDSTWAVIRPDKVTRLPRGRWTELRLDTAAPLEPRHTDAATEAAIRWSREPTWKGPAGNSRLFLFVRTAEPERFPWFHKGLVLLDAEGKLLVDFSDGNGIEKAAGWMAFTADLKAGYYILRRGRSGVRVRHQPVYLCDGWETQVFLMARRAPSLRFMSLNMAPLRTGFVPDDPSALAVEVVLDALRRGTPRRLLKNDVIMTLLRGEHRNPWLAVLAGYALTLFAEHDRFHDEEARDETTAAELFSEVTQFLRGRIGSHPDVRALMLDPAQAAEPFPHPPLLRAGLRRVMQHAVGFAKTIPPDSLTDRVIDHMAANSPWTAWRTFAPHRSRAHTAGKAAAPRERRIAVASPLLGTFPPKAPVFSFVAVPTGEVSALTGNVAMLQAATLHDAPLIEAAQHISESYRASGTVEKIVDLPQARTVGDLLGQVDPSQLSKAIGIPITHAEAGLQSLRGAGTLIGGNGPFNDYGEGASVRPVHGAGRAHPMAEQAIAAYVLRHSGFGSSQQSGDARELSANEPPEMPGAPLSTAPEVTIEDCVARLRAEAERLARSQEDETRSDGPRLRALSERLHGLADALLSRADFVAITDASGRVMYGNGAFKDLVADTYGTVVQDSWTAWHEAVLPAPLGNSPFPGSAFGGQGGLPVPGTSEGWGLGRTAVRVGPSFGNKLYVNVLHNERVPTLPADGLEGVDSILPRITLCTTLLAHGSAEQRDAVAKDLEASLEDVERIIRDSEANERRMT